MTKRRLRIVVGGGRGRMAERICALAAADPRVQVSARLSRRPSPGAAVPILALADAGRALRAADVLVDFSSPAASVRLARAAAAAGRPAVIGTTGFTAAQARALRALGRRAALFLSPNMSRAVNVLFLLARQAARALPGFEPAVSEIHHRRKRDAPSGTALRLAREVRAASGMEASVTAHRVGDVAGEHTLLMVGPGERLELVHRAGSRDIFARGALEAALWIAHRRPGLYDMQDLLGLS